jgi:hypothetical protein
MNFRLGLSLISVLVLAGCRDGGEGEEGTGTDTGELPSGDIALEDFFGLAEAAFCEWAVECHGFGVVERCANVMHFENELNMRLLTGLGADAPTPVDYFKEAVAVGRIEYDEEQAAACLEYVRTRSCDNPRYHVTSEAEAAGQLACAAVFTGRMGRNGPCMSALECAETAICGFDPNCVDMCCVGACRVLAEPLKLGEDCSNGNQTCESGTYCRFDQNTGMPTVCTAAPTAGQPCPDYVCGGGALCEFDGNMQVCVAPRESGAPCDYDDQCEPGLSCQHDQNYENGKCLRPADQGEACDPLSPDTVCRRFDNECDPVSETCGPLPGKGEPCPNHDCRGDFFCANEQCVPVADAGEGCGYVPNTGNFIPCSGDSRCAGDFDAGTCVAPSGETPCPVPADPVPGA